VSAYSDLILSRSPVAYWQLDETSGATAYDAASSYDLTFSGTPTFSEAPLITIGTSITDARTNVSASALPASLQGNNPKTVELWYYIPSGSSGVKVLFGMGSYVSNQGVVLQWNSPTEITFVFLSNDLLVSGLPDITGVHHIVGVFDGGKQYLYLDGVKIGERAATTNTGSGGFRIGGYSGNESFPYTGNIDEVAVYDYALTQQQIVENFQAGSREFARVDSYIDGITKDIIQQAKPLLYYKFDNQDYTGTSTVIDYSDYRDHSASVIGSPTQSDPLVSSGKSLTFTSGDYIALGSRPELNFSGEFSVEFWLNYTDTAQDIPEIIGNGVTNWTSGGVAIAIDDIVNAGANDRITFYSQTNTNGIVVIQSTANSIVSGTTYHVVIVRKGTFVGIYINGALNASNTVTLGDSYNFNGNNNTYIGKDGWNSLDSPYFTGSLDNFAIYNRALGSQEIEDRYYALLNIKKDKVKSLNPIVYWKLDETSGTTATDEMGNLDGTFVNSPTLSQEALVSDGGSSILLNGTTHSVTFSGATMGSLLNGKSGITISCWVEFPSSDDGYPFNIYMQTSTQCAFLYKNTGNYLSINAKSTAGEGTKSSSTYLVSQNVVYHIVGIINYAANTLLLYVNNELVGSNLSAGFSSGTVAFSSPNDGGISAGYNINQKADEYVIFDRAITASEVTKLYNSGLEVINETKKDHIQKLNPVAYWKLDEITGTTAYDSSGNGNHGTYSGTFTLSKTPLTKNGASVYFNGTTSADLSTGSLTALNFGANDWSIELWVNADSSQPNSYPALIATGTSGYTTGFIGVYYNHPGYENKLYLDNSRNGGASLITSEIPLGNTYHILIVRNGLVLTIYANGNPIGSTAVGVSEEYNWNHSSNTYFARANQSVGIVELSGYLDEIAVYNYALSEEQIQKNYLNNRNDIAPDDYEWTIKKKHPVAYWKLDETSGTTAYDAVGGYNLTFANTPTFSETPLVTTGTSITNARTNVSASALPSSLQGNNPKTVELWYNHSGSTAVVLFGMGSYSSNQGFVLQYNSSSELTLAFFSNDIVVSGISCAGLHHCVAAYDGTTQYIYLDGKLLGSRAASATNTSSGGFTIGSISGSPVSSYSGNIDEIAIYDYALTPYQILENYEVGKGTKFVKIDTKEEPDNYYV
jgi:hypothetical protein